MTAKKTTPAKKATASKAPAAKASPAPKAGARLVTWDDPIGDPEDGVTSTQYGLELHSVDLGEEGKATRVAVLTDFRIIDPKQLKDA